MTELIPDIGKHQIEVIKSPDEDPTCKTFVLHHEDHTLGNSLRYMLMKNPDVEYCGYSVPHPSENKINLRIQTYKTPSTVVLKKGLTDLQKACDHVLSTFQDAVKEYQENKTGTETDEEMGSDDESS